MCHELVASIFALLCFALLCFALLCFAWWSEILKVTDAKGRIAYDFATVLVNDRDNPKRVPHTIHAAYSPTLGIKPATTRLVVRVGPDDL